MPPKTVYRTTEEISGITIYSGSKILMWDQWPDDVVETLKKWNKRSWLRFDYLGFVGNRRRLFKCPGCSRFIDVPRGTVCNLRGYLICDDCIIVLARKIGAT